MEAAGFYLLRTPRLPLRAADMLNGNRGQQEMDAALKALLDDPAVRDALAYASPAVCRKAERWHREAAVPLTPKLRQTLYKYMLRMATRPTPYGLFAGVSCGTVANGGSAICLAPNHSPVIRPDVAALAAMARQLQADPAIRRGLTYRTNNTLTHHHTQVRYYGYSNQRGNRMFNRLRMERTRLLAMVTAVADGGVGYRSLVDKLLAVGLSGRQADAYIAVLVHHQVLLTDLEPSVSSTGKGWFHPALNGHPAMPQFMDAATGWPPGGALAANDRAVAALGGDDAPVFQCDVRTHTVVNRLDRRVVDTLVSEIHDLLPLNRPQVPAELQRFARRFTGRYGDRWVPLLEALDTEQGVGYGADAEWYRERFPLLDGLHFPGRQPSGEEVPQTALRVVCDKWSGQHEVELTKDDLLAIAGPSAGATAALPPTAYVLGNVLATDADALDRGDFRFHIAACGGCSALPLMARFAHLDTELEDRLRGMAAYEQQCYGEVVLAEMVHLPADRHGNILQRPHLRPYEIPVYTPSLLPAEQQIPLADLWVGVSAGEVVLYAARLGKRVMPRLASAHNAASGMDLYRFLCDVQHASGSMDVSWQWGALAALAFLPRVTYGHIVLSRARWRVAKRSATGMAAADAVQRLQKEVGFPNRVMLAEGDQELFLDFDQPLAAELFAARLRKGDVLLYECLTDAAAGPVVDRSGQAYANELIIPIKNRYGPLRPVALPGRLVPHRMADFPPGSEWLYVKCYAGPREAEYILATAIAPLLKKWRRRGAITHWFFVRYHDPEPHLRLRVRRADPASDTVLGRLVGEFNAAMDGYMQGRGAVKWQLDTYQPERERYHPEGMEHCESIFHIDSRTVLALLPAFSGSVGEQHRWWVACLGSAALLEAFGYSLEECKEATAGWRDAFFSEFGGDKRLRVELDSRYRAVRPDLERFMSGGDSLLHRALRARSERITPIAVCLQKRLSAVAPGALEQVVASLVHMFINRVFYANPRENELVVYHLLTKHFTAAAHRHPVGCRPSAT